MTSLENNEMNSMQIWLAAVRPRTLPAAASGVAMGSALAWRDGSFHWLPALAALLIALLLQIGSNLANDVYDFERGADTSARHGPLRVTQAGLLSPAQVKRGMWIIFGLAALLGLYLAFLRGWIVIALGLAAIISAIAYTGGPFPLGYYGLGDLFVFIFFGLAAVAGTYFAQAGFVSAAAWWMSAPIGLIVTAILVVNNLRDLENDRAAGKHTLAVMMGARATRVEYVLCIVVAYLLLPILIFLRIIPVFALSAWLSLPIAIMSTRIVFTQQGRRLNAALAGTGQTALVYSLLFFLGIIL
ncbi:MAG: 1,4-dihydroxy-2-naphthoate polyprenyltransferase [Chloroflexi bacterium]|nr:1,4-dihydroxy-2-naphthoate polyprenyltransferase [Chloroflexota bacterium]MBI3339463.1 1,4-dihydroxy-2-naphthoate polyprenyltransferase [Chloroflexota bacterium]